MRCIYTPRAIAVAVLTAASAASALAQVTVPANAGMNLPMGSALGMACTGLDVSGSMSLEASQIQSAAGVQIEPGGALAAGAGTITVSGDWINGGTFDAGTGTVVFADGCAAGPIALAGNTVFNNLTLTSLSGRTFILPQGSHITVNGMLTLQGAPGLPIQLASSGGGAVVTLGPGAQVVRSNANVNANVQIGAAAIAVPTLTGWGRIAAAVLVALAAAVALRRRRVPA